MHFKWITLNLCAHAKSSKWNSSVRHSWKTSLNIYYRQLILILVSIYQCSHSFSTCFSIFEMNKNVSNEQPWNHNGINNSVSFNSIINGLIFSDFFNSFSEFITIEFIYALNFTWISISKLKKKITNFSFVEIDQKLNWKDWPNSNPKYVSRVRWEIINKKSHRATFRPSDRAPNSEWINWNVSKHGIAYRNEERLNTLTESCCVHVASMSHRLAFSQVEKSTVHEWR